MTAVADAWVYRDARVREAGASVRARLLEAVLAERAVEAAVLAGEIEAALADAEHGAHDAIADVTDVLASAALGATWDARALAERIARVELPETLAIAAPEGFAYYALHPASYARAVERFERSALVVGVRSIGTTLSAFARAALGGQRMTVRPSGPAFARRYAPSPREIDAFRDAARVLVVDEGPGLSGSTLLAVVDGIAGAGVARSRIAVVCSHAPDPSRLLAPDGEARWRALDVVVASSEVPRGRDVSAGAWRALRHASAAAWPAVFAQAERRKVLADGRLVKWEGLGSAAMRARARASALARAGFSPEVRDEGDGWASTAWRGEPLGASNAGWLARYCAARAELFPATDAQPLEPMVTKNLGAPSPPLPIVRAVVADARMHRHEWLRDGDRILKVDAIAHGDDHFFPGPTDIAWDLAGAIVEHALPRGPFLAEYTRLSGDRAEARIEAWITAYAAFHVALARVALEQAAEDERVRLATRIDLLSRSTPRRGG